MILGETEYGYICGVDLVDRDDISLLQNEEVSQECRMPNLAADQIEQYLKNNIDTPLTWQSDTRTGDLTRDALHESSAAGFLCFGIPT